MNPQDDDAPPFYRKASIEKENTTPAHYSYSPNRILGRKRFRKITTDENYLTTPPRRNIQESAPVVIDLTEDDTLNSSVNSIILPETQDHSQYERDRQMALELQQYEDSIASARALHSNIHNHTQPRLRSPDTLFNYNTAPMGWINFQPEPRRQGRFQPPWSQSNAHENSFYDIYAAQRGFNREFNENDYEFLSSLDERVKKKSATRKEISALPIKKLKSCDIEKGDCCSICLQDFEKGDRVRTLPCTHFFHVKCIGQWLRVNKICPVDRKEISPAEIWKTV